MSSSLSKREINRQRWFDHIETWKQSGVTRKAFCEQQRLGLASFQRWCLFHHTHHHWNTALPAIHPNHSGIFPEQLRTTLKIHLLLPVFPPIPVPGLTETLSIQHLATTQGKAESFRWIS